MATVLLQIINNLLELYSLTDKTVISIGAGGGQLIEYGRNTAKVYAIDNDETAIQKLSDNLIKSGLADKFTLIHSDFYLTDLKGDVVLFEFCLHEMSDPKLAIRHAQTMAPDILIIDHLPDTDWAYIIDEKEKIEKSWSALESFNVRKSMRCDAFQHFTDYNEIYQKVYVQGENSINRIQGFKEKKHFTIPMSYGIALI